MDAIAKAARAALERRLVRLLASSDVARELRHAAHLYHAAKSPVTEEELYRAALAFALAAVEAESAPMLEVVK